MNGSKLSCSKIDRDLIHTFLSQLVKTETDQPTHGIMAVVAN
ncbi:MAG: hypothetical protein U0703_16935 [Anaerolineae bacterium]